MTWSGPPSAIKERIFIYPTFIFVHFSRVQKGCYFCTKHFAGIAVGHDSPRILLSSGCLVNTQLWHPSGFHMLQLAKQVENKLKAQRLNCESVTCELTPPNFSSIVGQIKWKAFNVAWKSWEPQMNGIPMNGAAILKTSTLTAANECLNNSQSATIFFLAPEKNWLLIFHGYLGKMEFFSALLSTYK